VEEGGKESSRKRDLTIGSELGFFREDRGLLKNCFVFLSIWCMSVGIFRHETFPDDPNKVNWICQHWSWERGGGEDRQVTSVYSYRFKGGTRGRSTVCPRPLVFEGVQKQAIQL
jgi:hypothetical protein